jgi:hypothetical protein
VEPGRRRWREKLETYVVVTVVAVLVWLYAEGENVKLYNNEPVAVQFVAPEGQQLAVEPAEPIRVLASFRGSSGQFQQFYEIVRSGPLEVPVNTDPARLGTPQFPIVTQLLDQTALGRLGISGLTTDPQTVEVLVRELQTVRLPVEVDVRGVELVRPATVEPSEVRLTLPADQAQAAVGRRATVRLTPSELDPFPPGEPHSVQGTIELPLGLDSPWTRIEPRTVLVQFEKNPRVQTRTVTLDSVNVYINVPGGAFEFFSVRLPAERRVPTVRVSGPADLIERIQPSGPAANGPAERLVWAEVRPTTQRLREIAAADGPVLEPLHFVYPEGLTVDSAVTQVPLAVEEVNREP